ncbi:MAG: hypothetical protein AUJ86_01510 [Hydrogenophilaceae bacterium CG1_02_62_390]|nr:HAMP domain-containing protein [Betaproteobacteria bacterium]OIO79491.1 MAG: hypothetical protein AUJ86_01510 [Hydrogenophilaceae bacterium CG1_02_62_390]
MRAHIRKSISSIVLSVFILVFTGVLAVGGASVFLAWRMLGQTHAIAEESRDVNFVNQLQNKISKLILLLHEWIDHSGDEYRVEAAHLTVEIDTDIRHYLEHETESRNQEKTAEIQLLNNLQAELPLLSETTNRIQRLPGSSNAGSDTQAYWEEVMEQHAYRVHAIISDINQIHFKIISRKVTQSGDAVALVFFLYILFSLVGIVLVYIGYRLHSRFIVKPVVNLAKATERISQGDLSLRLNDKSKTEIGLLYRSFNAMVEQLQSNKEEILAFNRDLSLKVEERSRELNAAHNKMMGMEKMAMLGQIATSVNHEIRTPLNALYMNVQLIRKEISGGSNATVPDRRLQQRHTLDRIDQVEQEVMRISSMLEEFVHYARLAPPEMKPVDVDKLIRYVADLLNEKATQSGVTLGLDLAEPAPYILADEKKLIQTLMNLGMNAMHAMPEGGALKLSVRAPGDQVEIAVADTGTGIAAENLEKIFQPFFTTKPSGLGFGLAIVQRIVEGHGGKIDCQSKLGEGTVFTIRLPRIDAPTGDAQT